MNLMDKDAQYVLFGLSLEMRQFKLSPEENKYEISALESQINTISKEIENGRYIHHISGKKYSELAELYMEEFSESTDYDSELSEHSLVIYDFSNPFRVSLDSDKLPGKVSAKADTSVPPKNIVICTNANKSDTGNEAATSTGSKSNDNNSRESKNKDDLYYPLRNEVLEMNLLSTARHYKPSKNSLS